MEQIIIVSTIINDYNKFLNVLDQFLWKKYGNNYEMNKEVIEIINKIEEELKKEKMFPASEKSLREQLISSDYLPAQLEINFEENIGLLNIDVAKTATKYLKILLKYGVMDEKYGIIGGQTILSDRKGLNPYTQFLKFKIINNKLYIYDNVLNRENQKLLPVKEINKISVEKVIKKIREYFGNDISDNEIEQLLMHQEVLKSLEIIKTEFIITIENKGKNIEFSLSKTHKNNEMFKKKHEKAEILKSLEMTPIEKEYKNDNYKLEYAYDSSCKLLKTLLNMSSSENDKSFFYEILSKQIEEYGYKEKEEMNMDWMIMSSFLLFNEKYFEQIPDWELEQILEIIKNHHLLKGYILDENNNIVGGFDDNDIGCNTHIIDKTNNINNKQLFISIRNALAHSSYEVINKNYIRLYGYDPNNNHLNFNILLSKNVINMFINDLQLYGNFNNIFPQIIVKDISLIPSTFRNNQNMKSKQQIIEFLNLVSIAKLEKYSFNCHNSSRNSLKYIMIISELEKYGSLMPARWNNKDNIQTYFNNLKINEIVNGSIKYENLTEEDYEYILKEISKDENHFYQLSLSHQCTIINQILTKKYYTNQSIDNSFKKIITTFNKDGEGLIESLDKTSTEYINIDNYIGALIISYLNDILLYSYNENLNLDYSEIDFSNMEIQKDILTQRNYSNIENLNREYDNLEKELEDKLRFIDKKKREKQLLENKGISNNYYYSLKETIDTAYKEYDKIYPEKIEKMKEIKYRIYEEMFNISDIQNEAAQINKTVFTHLRNSLAHGNISFPNGIDTNEIINTKILFEDYKNERKTFSATITIKDLLIQLTNKRFYDSIFKNNSNYNNQK